MPNVASVALFASCLLACSSSHSSSHSSDDLGGSDADAAPDTSPISAPDDTWTWVDFPESRCASGSATGLGVSLHPNATNVLIYFEGGGACSSAETCWGSDPGATNLSGFDATTFSTTSQKNYPIFDRTNATNPYLGWSFVFVPYCTGDLHAGDTIVDFTVNGSPMPTYFWGGHDVDVFLQRLVPTFAGAQRLTLAGTSAGGFASFLMWDRVVKAFGGLPTDILDDSGPAIAGNGKTDNTGLIKGWGYTPPAGCAAPCDSFFDILSYDRATQPNSRYGFLTFSQDTVISMLFGYTLDEYASLMTSYSMQLAGDPNAATYIVTNEQSHVVETDPTLVPDFMPWIQQMATGSSAWMDQTFMHP